MFQRRYLCFFGMVSILPMADTIPKAFYVKCLNEDIYTTQCYNIQFVLKQQIMLHIVTYYNLKQHWNWQTPNPSIYIIIIIIFEMIRIIIIDSVEITTATSINETLFNCLIKCRHVCIMINALQIRMHSAITL